MCPVVAAEILADGGRAYKQKKEQEEVAQEPGIDPRNPGL